MQKKIIALAIAAAFSAPAFAADVTMYGVVDGAIARISGSGQKSDLIAVSGGLSGSRFGVKAVEELDGGMKAVAVLEYALDTETSSSVGNARQEMLALAGDFGTVATGYLQTTAYDFAGKFDPAFGSSVSPWQNVTKGGGFLIGAAAGAARAPRALAYISPAMGGVTLAVNYATSIDNTWGNLAQPSGATTGLKTSASLLSATYTLDALTVGAVYASAKSDNTGSNPTKEMALGGSYDLGVAKLMGTYQTQSTSGTTGSNKAMSFSAVAPVGPGAVAFTYAKNTMGTTTADDNGSGMTVAWLQGLSKTVTAYGALSKMSNGAATNVYSVSGNVLGGGTAAQGAAAPGNTSLTAGGSSTLIAVGLKKVF